jgi:hypothetical protein
MKLVLASSNHGKLEELRGLLSGEGIELIAQSDLGVEDAEETGATFEPMISAVDPSEHPMNERYPERLALEGLAGLKFDLKHVFLDEAPNQIDDVRRLLAERPVDALLVDVATLGAPMLAALGGPPWAAYGVSVLTMGGPDVAPFGTTLSPGGSFGYRIRNRLLAAATEGIIFRDVVRHERGIRRRLGVPQRIGPFLESTISPYLYLQPATPDSCRGPADS